jgi:hypothetical protein
MTLLSASDNSGSSTMPCHSNAIYSQSQWPCRVYGQLRVKSRDDGEMFLFYVLDAPGLDRGPIYEHY